VIFVGEGAREKQDTICGGGMFTCTTAKARDERSLVLAGRVKLRWTGPHWLLISGCGIRPGRQSAFTPYCCGGIRRGGGLVEMSFRLQQTRFTSGLW
jgi:hypothetical protein